MSGTSVWNIGGARSDVHVVELLLALPPIHGGAGRVGAADIALAQRRHQQPLARTVHVRETAQPLVQVDPRRSAQSINIISIPSKLLLFILIEFYNSKYCNYLMFVYLWD